MCNLTLECKKLAHTPLHRETRASEAVNHLLCVEGCKLSSWIACVRGKLSEVTHANCRVSPIVYVYICLLLVLFSSLKERRNGIRPPLSRRIGSKDDLGVNRQRSPFTPGHL